VFGGHYDSLSAAQRTARLCKVRQSPKRDRFANYVATPSTSDLRTEHGARLGYGLESTNERSVYLLSLAASERYQIRNSVGQFLSDLPWPRQVLGLEFRKYLVTSDFFGGFAGVHY
jgi:hypothetical protein